VWSQLIDMSGTPRQQARRLLSLLFPNDVAKSIYREFGDIVAAARAQLSPDLVNRQVAAMDAWHRIGIGNRLGQMNVSVLIASGTADIVIPPSNALKGTGADLPSTLNLRKLATGRVRPTADFRNQRVQAFQRLRIGFA